MRFSLLSAALLLAVAAPVLSSPLTRNTEVEFKAHNAFAATNGVSAVAGEGDIDVKFSETVFSSRYNKCLASNAHSMYKEALDIYHRVNKMMFHTLTKEGLVREEYLIEIVTAIQAGEDILLKAGFVNNQDDKFLRRHWVRFEIEHLSDKFAFAHIRATHLPNLAFACHAYHFVVDEVTLAVTVAASIPGLVVLTIKEAAHAVHRVLHHIKTSLKWVVHEIEEEFIYIGHKIHEWAHNLKEKVEARWELHLEHQHERWDNIKNFFHHSCETSDCVPCHKEAESCPANGVVLLVEDEEVDISIKLTRKQAQYEVTKTVKEMQREEVDLNVQLRETETSVLAADWS